jgi:hypothetical protein
MAPERRVRQLVTAIAVGRVAFGVTMLVAPRMVGRRWIGEAGDQPAVSAITRGLGARDAIIGAGTILAARDGAGLARWVQAAALADAADAIAIVAVRRHVRPAQVAAIVAIAAPAALVGAWASTRVG